MSWTKRPSAMKIVRRTHLYLGLVVFPWAMFFGLSGILFNHPNAGEDMKKRFVPPAEVERLSGLTPADPSALAATVVERLGAKGHSLQLDAAHEPGFVGWSLFQAAAPEGRHVVILDLEAGNARIGTRTAVDGPELASFSGARVVVPGRMTTDVKAHVERLLPALEIVTEGPLVTNLKAGPELRFRVKDAQSRSWNVIYNLGTEQIEARAVDSEPVLGFNETLARMHKTHHFPVEMGPTFLWAIFADLTGLTMILWALTGMLMWWQMKKTRKIGAVFVVFGLFVAGAVFAGVIDHLTFGDVKKPSGPGPEPPHFESKTSTVSP
ncbi:MAG: PepSY domain-containing protein [Deltaproteobacteria bacterium]|jgi:hypothetical protein